MSTTKEIDALTIRFAGDSGDGMQLTGAQFTNASAIFGNDISTLPDFPAEIRAPAGTLAGVSGFQVNFSSEDIYTPGDSPEVLVAMNPAALKANLSDVPRGGTIIVNKDAFSKNNLKKAGYENNPLEDDSLLAYQVHTLALTSLNRKALEDITSLSTKEKDRCQNFFALGLTFWAYDRPMEPTLKWVKEKFKKLPDVVAANERSLQAGYYYGENTETFQIRYRVKSASSEPGVYRKVTGNEAIALGMATVAKLSQKPIFYGSYPITPASDILHNLSPLKHFNIRTFQAEDEIAAVGAAIGAAFGGSLAATGTSGPGICLKSEAIGLAAVYELPLVVINVQRGGPSTGSPTKPEQSDLLQAMFGRNGESPVAILSPQSPADCFDTIIEAFRWAVRIMGPVFVLSDGFLANSSEPWKIPNPQDFLPIEVKHAKAEEGKDFLPYKRDPETLSRPWAIPGTPGMEHRLGGLSKEPGTGNVSYAADHQQKMTDDRAEKVARLTEIIPPLQVHGESKGKLLILGWGASYGAIRSATEKAQKEGKSVSYTHLRYLNPFPKDLEEICANFEQVLVPELNMGQLTLLLRGKYKNNFVSYGKVQGQPFKIEELYDKICELT